MRDSIALNGGKGKKEGARPQPVMPDPDPASILLLEGFGPWTLDFGLWTLDYGL